jgi:hypothetical protein
MQFGALSCTLALMFAAVVSAQAQTAITVPNNNFVSADGTATGITGWTLTGPSAPYGWVQAETAAGTVYSPGTPDGGTGALLSAGGYQYQYGGSFNPGGGSYNALTGTGISQTLPTASVAGATYTLTVAVYNAFGPVTTGTFPSAGNTVTIALSTGGAAQPIVSDWGAQGNPGTCNPILDANGNGSIVSGGTPIATKTFQDMDPTSAGYVDYTITGQATANGQLLIALNYCGDGAVTVSNVRLTVTGNLIPGDINGDGLVDVADYNIWAANVGKTGATWSQGDLNGDGLVDVADYNIWAANVGKTAATPEPISMIVLAIGGGLVALRRNRA